MLDMFFETSAKTGYNSQKVFIEAAKLLYTQYKENGQNQNNNGNNSTFLVYKSDKISKWTNY